MNPSVCHILPAAHNSPADQSIFPYLLPPTPFPQNENEMVPQFMLFFLNFQI